MTDYHSYTTHRPKLHGDWEPTLDPLLNLRQHDGKTPLPANSNTPQKSPK